MSGDDRINTSRIVIIPGAFLGAFNLIVLCIILVFMICRRREIMHDRKTLDQTTNRLDVLLPTNTIEQWLPATKAKMKSSEATGEYFVCVVCLEQVDRTERVHELQCLHVFHWKYLRGWYIRGHYNCPLYNRPYFIEDSVCTAQREWVDSKNN
ncbi:uncharacterized protein BO95DRAFT_350596 [Aspergillus brunneoviolaceus CBS 621.78]|uniref:Uncharacterized protein n=1 Tax=Aspergillus brunneoviolaceus CBS 621.78 TaxID=1450534 RepID=A0ACD1GPG3_9EURO|nr:hypothetical protein BO95DRAFT_350596 [Aspergillus brunneoviolaceus CBS 621.78]RAH51178.1 hypothetical protein BO95DRAFT_350596 [Aspergillus brunneoviolaceus CBS 621.78]